MKPIIQWKGMELLGYWIPPFDVFSGSLISLWLPGNSKENGYVGSRIEEELIQLLTGKKKHAAIRIEQPVRYADHWKGDVR